ncbi:hypothetical protein IC229_05020 [Spirosoma sp. BT702]|uniref:Uncharacterized protein n=1 Tax=Spirosoma profusum TaxID=2771354 RepID=A0A926XUJ9_9BACT|nr:hypothetical protein [Spirosoma profusum]MBD2699985.1 hypothetical protein [Spirosoma profusum]
MGPLPDQSVVEPADIELNAFQPEAYEVYMHNPLNYTEVEHLQQWVRTL